MSAEATPSVPIDIVERLFGELDTAVLCETVIALAQDELQAQAALLLLGDNLTTPLTLAAAAGIDPAEQAAICAAFAAWLGTTAPLLDGVPLLAWLPGKPQLYPWPGTPRDAMVCVPLVRRMQVIGALCLRMRFVRVEREALLLFAEQAAIALSNAIKHQRAIQAEKLAGMGRLVTSLAHELNNPLQALKNSLELLRHRPLEHGKREHYMALAHQQAEQLASLVQRMLELYRPLGEGTRLSSPHESLEAALALAAPQLTAHRIEVVRDWDGNLPRVREIGSCLRQVFLSLLQNAIEAMPEGGRVTICTRVVDTGAAQVRRLVLIEVSDTGGGVAPQTLARIFEPLHSTKHDQAGLGLAVSYSIIEQHGGTLSVRANEYGTTLRVLLPAVTSRAG